MPNIKLPYNAEGMELADKIADKVEDVGGEISQDVPTNDASMRNTNMDLNDYEGGGDVNIDSMGYYQEGGKINIENNPNFNPPIGTGVEGIDYDKVAGGVGGFPDDDDNETQSAHPNIGGWHPTSYWEFKKGGKVPEYHKGGKTAHRHTKTGDIPYRSDYGKGGIHENEPTGPTDYWHKGQKDAEEGIHEEGAKKGTLVGNKIKSALKGEKGDVKSVMKANKRVRKTLTGYAPQTRTYKKAVKKASK